MKDLERKELRKKKKHVMYLENAVAATYFSVTALSATSIILKGEIISLFGVLMLIINAAFMFCHAMGYYHKGASDAWLESVEMLQKALEKSKEEKEHDS